MRSKDNPIYIGVDFGTTNTVVSLCDNSGATRTLLYPSVQGPLTTFRSILCYVIEDGESLSTTTRVLCGPAAIDAFLQHGEEARLIQSVKTFFKFEHWHRLSFLKRPAVLGELKAIKLSSDSPEKMARLRLFLEQELGFHLYQAVNQCKAALSAPGKSSPVTNLFP